MIPTVIFIKNSRVVDKIGFKSGKLTVMEYAYTKDNRSYWKCLCECGNNKVISSTNLGTKKTKTCGECIPVEIMILKAVYRDYQQRSKIKGLIFTIKESDFLELIKKDCYYCNSKPSNVKKIAMYAESRVKGKSTTYNGLDRIDNSKGYILENIKPCCEICNMMKSTLTVEQFYCHIKKIIKMNEDIFGPNVIITLEDQEFLNNVTKKKKQGRRRVQTTTRKSRTKSSKSKFVKATKKVK